MNMRSNEAGWWMRAALWMAMAAAASAQPWKAGDTLPSLAGHNLDGAIPDTAGKVVLIDFWASWCGPCKASFPVLDKLQKEYGPKGLVVLGVNVDKDAESMQRFLKAHPVAFAVVQDRQQKLVAEAEVEGMPTSFLVDRAGKIHFVHRGFEGAKTEGKLREHIAALLGGGTKP